MTTPADAHPTAAEIREAVRVLTNALGPTLTAYIAGQPDRRYGDLHGWALEHGPLPAPEDAIRLHWAHRCWMTLTATLDPDIARHWFIGSNPRLDGTPPGVAIRVGHHEAVLAAAQAFANDDHY